ncbi:peptidase [Paenibacillus sp. ACRRX]|uniref:peptidase n=1 Tax=Paenibacillus sp. ACRRX TaxID=2918206 RepID=UPI001EF6DBEB|nr:peptidase [Paenibacillus sp. ACRRX]MCG7408889.1 peptidase [Paenibacillus sp. ACRRX]
MNKMYKVLTTASILAIAAMPLAASAQNGVPVKSDSTVQQQKAVPGTMGFITDFVNDHTGKFITVTGRGLAATDQSEMVLSLTKNTKIIDSKGKTVPLKTIIDEKKVVKAFYTANGTDSARGTALTLVVQDHSFAAILGKVTEVRENGIVVKGADLYNMNMETIVLHFADKAQLLDQDGKAIKAGDIQPGMTVKAFYGPAVAMSLPPQSTTNYVMVDTTDVQADAPGTAGIITNVTDGKLTVIGNPLEKGGVNYVILSIDENTRIVSEDGKPLTKEALKADVRVEARYGEVLAAIYPAQTHAESIVVKTAETKKVEGTIIATDRAGEGQVYVNVGSDQSTDNDVILNISKETTVIPVLGGDIQLKAGMKIVAYHSPIMTKSLPGITNAEIVIVTADENSSK